MIAVNIKLKNICLQVGITTATVQTIWLLLFTWILSVNVKVRLSKTIFLLNIKSIKLGFKFSALHSWFFGSSGSELLYLVSLESLNCSSTDTMKKVVWTSLTVNWDLINYQTVLKRLGDNESKKFDPWYITLLFLSISWHCILEFSSNYFFELWSFYFFFNFFYLFFYWPDFLIASLMHKELFKGLYLILRDYFSLRLDLKLIHTSRELNFLHSIHLKMHCCMLVVLVNQKALVRVLFWKLFNGRSVRFGIRI